MQSTLARYTFRKVPHCPSLCATLYVSLVQEMTLGSSELLYVAGSYLPITIEEEEEEECREEPPRPPPRVSKIPACHNAEPKISFSYTHDPRLTPTRKVSSQSQASLSAEGPSKLAASTRSLNSLAPPSPKYSSSTPQTLPRRKRARKDKDEDFSQPVVTPRQKKRVEADPTPPPRAKSAEIKLPASFPNFSPSEVHRDGFVGTIKEITNVEETSPRLLAPPRRYATIPRREKGEGRVSHPITCPQLTVCGDPRLTLASFSCRELTQLILPGKCLPNCLSLD